MNETDGLLGLDFAAVLPCLSQISVASCLCSPYGSSLLFCIPCGDSGQLNMFGEFRAWTDGFELNEGGDTTIVVVD